MGIQQNDKSQIGRVWVVSMQATRKDIIVIENKKKLEAECTKERIYQRQPDLALNFVNCAGRCPEKEFCI